MVASSGRRRYTALYTSISLIINKKQVNMTQQELAIWLQTAKTRKGIAHTVVSIETDVNGAVTSITGTVTPVPAAGQSPVAVAMYWNANGQTMASIIQGGQSLQDRGLDLVQSASIASILNPPA